jgi:phosphoribosyl 1,2-cyclic phosphate phosphodiesterase
MAKTDTSLAGQLVLLGTGTSHGVPVIGCDCPTCSSTDPRNQRTRCAAVVGLPTGNLLIDTPPELRIQLIRERIGVIHAVAMTHGHADHLFGLDDLRIFPRYLHHEVPIYCEPAVEQTIRRAFAYAFDPAVAHYPAGYLPKLVFRRIGSEAFEALGVRVQPIRLVHGAESILGYRIGNAAYCTDAKQVPPESLSLLEGLDVLVINALRHKPHPTHMTLEEAVEVARRVRPRQTYFTHVSHYLEHEATNRRLPPGMALAYDGLRIPFRWE